MKRTDRLKTTRFFTFFILFTLAMTILFGRFFQIQVLEGKDYSLKSLNQCWHDITIKAQRGAIYDRNGNTLAKTTMVENFYVNTDSIEHIEAIADKISSVIDIPRHKLYKKLVSRLGKRTSLVKKANPIVSAKIKSYNLKGVFWETEPERLYPYGRAVSTFIGHINHKHEPQAGVEKYCDEYLRGVDGLRKYIKDGHGNLYPVLNQPDIPPVNGKDIILTIDIEYQQILLEEVQNAVNKWQALSGMGVLMDVHSGEILAITHYDPAITDPEYKYPKERAITDLFEPGSTFKTLVFGALLEEGLIDLKDTIYAGEGCFKFNGRNLHDDKELDIITQAEAFVLSSNIATGRLALRLGPKKLYRYSRDFGFGLPTGLDFPSEPVGRFGKPEVWSDYYCAMLSIGHEVSTSALHIAQVFGVIANDGKLMKPQLIKKVISPEVGVVKKFHPEMIRKIFSEETVNTMQNLCALVVDTGTAQVAKIDGIEFSGKTGTAEKYTENGYDKSKYIASFGGYFPRKNPQVYGIIIIDEPEKVNYGGYTAGPAFANCARRITDLQNRTEAINNHNIGNHTSSNHEYKNIDAELFKQDSEIICINETDMVKKSLISRITKGDSTQIFLPSLAGKSLRSAVSEITSAGLLCSIEGKGKVIRTVPDGDTYIQPDQVVKLICSSQEEEVDH